jgi:hypothetical protein
MKSILKTLLSLLIAVTLVMTANAAFASTAANTQIFNQATLAYTDGGVAKTATASVIVTVTLVPSAVTVVPGPTPPPTSYTPGATVQNTFIVTNQSNGPDLFDLEAIITGQTNTSGATATVTNPSPPAKLALGGSITVTGSTTTAIKVPSDGSSADAVVNGISNTSTIVINGETRTVSSVVDPGGTGVATITLSSALTSAPGAGVTVGEQKTVTVDVTVSSIITSGTNITVSKKLKVTSATSPNPSTESTPITDTFTSGIGSLTKYVRNLTTGEVGTTPLNKGNTYYQSGIHAKTGDVLEYALVAGNGGSGTISATVITDTLPTEFVTLKTGQYSGVDLLYENEAGTTTALTVADDGDTGKYSAGTITVNAGSGATPTNGSNLGGSIAAGLSVFVYYQVTVK